MLFRAQNWANERVRKIARDYYLMIKLDYDAKISIGAYAFIFNINNMQNENDTFLFLFF